jgi:hypothetical protein
VATLPWGTSCKYKTILSNATELKQHWSHSKLQATFPQYNKFLKIIPVSQYRLYTRDAHVPGLQGNILCGRTGFSLVLSVEHAVSHLLAYFI